MDAIVYATGFKATEYLFPMSITGRGGKTVEELWSQTGAQGYVGAMIPGCPNLWTLYGPNTNGGLLVPAFQEMETYYALKCIERLILDDKKSIDVKEEPYRRYNEMIDERNQMHGVERPPRAELLLDEVWPLRDAESADTAGDVELAAGTRLRRSRRALTHSVGAWVSS